MHTLLVNAHPDPYNPASFSNRLLQHLQARLPATDIERLSLYDGEIPELNADVMQIPAHRQSGRPLSEEQQRLSRQMEAILAQFKAARRLVISLPLHNFNVPARLKSYVDNIVVPGQTFRYTPEGRVQGLMNDDRKLLVIQASGSVCSDLAAVQGPEPSLAFLKAVFQDFLGFNEFAVIRAEGTQTAGLDPARILQEARERIDALLPGFMAPREQTG